MLFFVFLDSLMGTAAPARLVSTFSLRSIYDLGLGSYIEVSAFIENGLRKFPYRSTDRFIEISGAIDSFPIPQTDFNDELIWLPSDDERFSTETAFKSFFHDAENVTWHDLI